MQLYELTDKATEYLEFSCKPSFSKYREGYVIDEDKSVKWNREEVEKHNIRYQEEVKRLNNEKNKLYTELVSTIKEYIIEETNVKKTRAEKIYNYLYEEHSGNILEMLDYIDDLLDLFK